MTTASSAFGPEAAARFTRDNANHCFWVIMVFNPFLIAFLFMGRPWGEGLFTGTPYSLYWVGAFVPLLLNIILVPTEARHWGQWQIRIWLTTVIAWAVIAAYRACPC